MCDLPLWFVPEAELVVTPNALEGSTIEGEEMSLLGASVAIVPAESGPGRLVAGAPGDWSSEFVGTISWTLYTFYTLDWSDLYESTKTVAEIWVFDGPLPEGTLSRGDTRSVLVGAEISDILSASGEGWSLTVGDFTGDGAEDIVSVGMDRFDIYTWEILPNDTPLQLIEMPPPAGEHLLSEVAWASGENRGELSAGDWNHDGAADLAFSGIHNSGFGLDGTFTGAQILGGPLQGGATDGDRLARIDLSAAAPNVSATIERSAFIPDMTGDGTDDLLIKTAVLVSPDDPYASDWDYEGWYSGLALFEGGGDEMGLDSAIALLNAPCTYGLEVLPTGDLSGDGRADVAIWSRSSTIGDGGLGIVWAVSQMGEFALSPPTSPLSLNDLSDAIVLGREGVDTHDVAAADLDQDGISELFILAGAKLHVFMGPLQGMLDVNDADLIITNMFDNPSAYSWALPSLAVGDLDGDAIPEIVVGDPNSGANLEGKVHVFSGTSLLRLLQ